MRGSSLSELRVGVMASGSGTNLEAILRACARDDFPARVVLVICNVAGAGAIERAQKAGVPCEVLEHGHYASREAFDTELVKQLQSHEVELVCLAGFMRLVTPVLLDAFKNRVINIHPSLLPSFPGLHAQRQALEYGVRITGATVHFVDPGTDTGPVLIQSAVPVLPGDTEASLTTRILATEHRIYPEAIRLLAEDRVEVDGRQVRIRNHAGDGFEQYNPGVRS